MSDSKPEVSLGPNEYDDAYVMRYIMACRDESRLAKQNRMLINRDNYAMYQLRHDFSHKLPGQSREVLSKTRDGVEQIKSFFQQALADLDDWFRITTTDGTDGFDMLITPSEMQKLLGYMLKKADYFSHVGKSLQAALLGSLAISQVGGKLVPKPKYKTHKEGKGKAYRKIVTVTDDKTWELSFDDIRQENYYPDDTCTGLYEVIEYEVDLHIVKALAEGDDAIYDKEAVDRLQPWIGVDLIEARKARETGQNIPAHMVRPRVRITELWGTIVDQNTGIVFAENIVATLANETTLIRKPTANPLWHQRSNLVAAALIEVNHSPWGIALMDAGTRWNRAALEMFNLMIDASFKSVWGLNQIRTSDMAKPEQLTDGIRWGLNLEVNPSLMPGAHVLEPLISGELPQSVIEFYNLLTQELTTSMKTSDLRMGAQSMRAVKATEVAASENSLTSIFQGMAKNYESKKVQPELELATYEIAQNFDRIDKTVFVSLFGKERGEALAALEPQDVFVEVINGMKFEVFGISLTLRRQNDFRKYTTFLQMIAQSEVLTEAFVKTYSFDKVLGEVMTALDLDKSKILAQPPVKSAGQDVGGVPPQSQQSMAQPGGAPGASPNMQSQVPQPQGPPAQGGLAALQMNQPSAQALR